MQELMPSLGSMKVFAYFLCFVATVGATRLYFSDEGIANITFSRLGAC